MNNNEIYLNRVHINQGQAIAIRDTLLEAAKVHQQKETVVSFLEANPFVIKTLIVNDCGMTDDIFAILLDGIVAQCHLKNLHYISNNLGPKSTERIVELMRREKAELQLHELNLSNLKI